MAEWVDCGKEDLVFVPNATSGVNTVLRSLEGTWKKGDRIAFVESSMYVPPSFIPAAPACATTIT
jgi:hypothetical protein